MKQTIRPPAAIAIVVVIAVAICGALYWKFFHQQVYTVDDIAAKYKAAAAQMHGPPGQQPK